MSDNCYSMDGEELVLIGTMYKERLKSVATGASEACLEDKSYIDELERELRNCSQEIGFLQDQLNLRTVEADYMGEHVHILESNLAEIGKLHEKIRLLNEELGQLDSRNLVLTQEIRLRENELQRASLHVERLETTVSSIALESQCEIESMKLDITALEHRCLEAERFSQQAVHDKAKVDELLEELESKFKEAQERISFLEEENKELNEKLVMPERNIKESSFRVEHHNSWLKLMNQMIDFLPSGSNQDLLVKLREEQMSLKEMGTCEEVLGPFLSKLASVNTSDENVKNEIEKMTNQIHESELTIKKLKEELREEKQKAKEEAEDLTQAMAELRYELMGMLEEECKRRSCIEQASLQRIQDLEAQVRKEQKRSFAALRRFQEVYELAEMRLREIRHLKDVSEGLCRSTTLELADGGIA